MCEQPLTDSRDFWGDARWIDESQLGICGWHSPCYVWWKSNTAFHSKTLACGGSGVSDCIKTFSHLMFLPWVRESHQALSSVAKAEATQGHYIFSTSEWLKSKAFTLLEKQSLKSRAWTSNSCLKANKCHWAEVDLYRGKSQNSSTTLCETEQVYCSCSVALNAVKCGVTSNWM